jgi:murein DD-endopeptidase MepM/ murein hydrolase activator NlpD
VEKGQVSGLLPLWFLLSTLTDPMRRRPPYRLVPIATLVLACLVAPSVGNAASSAQSGDRRRELQEAIGEASAAEAAALAELSEIRGRRMVIEAKVAELEAQRATAEAKLGPLEAEAARLAAAYVELQAKVVQTQARLDAAQAKLDATAASLYRTERRGDSYDVVFTSRPDDLVSQEQYLDRVGEKRRGIVKRVTVLRDELESQREKLEAQKAEADRLAAEARAVRDQIAALQAEIEPARVQVAQEQFLEQQSINNIQGNKARYESELAAMSATSDSIGGQLRSRGGVGGGAPCEARPVPGPITSGYGPRYHPVLHYNRMHTGADMRASSGTPIRACRSGTVVIAGSQGGYGNAVVIDHGGGMGTLYAHQSRIAVSNGEQVTAGQIIGYVGSTGMSTGPHLHFEVRLSGNPVDPAPYL